MKIRTATLAIITAAFGFSPLANAQEGDKEEPPRRERPPGPPRDGEGPPRGEGERDRPGPPRDGEGRRPGGFTSLFETADSNGDKKISLQEWKDASAKRAEESFKRMDGDGDGIITEEELAQLRNRFRAGGGEGRPEGRPRGPREGGDEGGEGARRPRRPEAE